MDRINFEQLVADIAKGDEGAYRRLLEGSARVLRGYLLTKMPVAARGDIEDVVQETLLAVHLKYASYDRSYPFLPWLRAVANHKLIDHLRRKKIGSTVSIDDDLGDTLAALPSETDTTLTLETLLTQLPDKQQRVVRLARLEGKSMAEIASEMSLSVADVKVTLHRAIQKLAASVKKEEEAFHAHG